MRRFRCARALFLSTRTKTAPGRRLRDPPCRRPYSPERARRAVAHELDACGSSVIVSAMEHSVLEWSTNIAGSCSPESRAGAHSWASCGHEIPIPDTLRLDRLRSCAAAHPSFSILRLRRGQCRCIDMRRKKSVPDMRPPDMSCHGQLRLQTSRRGQRAGGSRIAREP